MPVWRMSYDYCNTPAPEVGEVYRVVGKEESVGQGLLVRVLANLPKQMSQVEMMFGGEKKHIVSNASLEKTN